MDVKLPTAGEFEVEDDYIWYRVSTRFSECCNYL